MGNRLAGEIGESTFGDFANKQHEGFIGHAVLGSWVNLGAMTTCSDLKNNYGPVRVDLGWGEVDSGLRFVGLLMGDHAKTAIGTLFNTGTCVGFASQHLRRRHAAQARARLQLGRAARQPGLRRGQGRRDGPDGAWPGAAAGSSRPTRTCSRPWPPFDAPGVQIAADRSRRSVSLHTCGAAPRRARPCPASFRMVM